MGINKKLIAFRRKDDGELFTLNEDGETFSLLFMKQYFPKSLNIKYNSDNFTYYSGSFDKIYQDSECKCGGYFNDWNSHASDCIVINKKGKTYN